MRHVTWWVHGIVALLFVAAIPHTKALHMLAGPAGVAVRDPAVGRDLPAEPEAGYATFADFLPRHLVDLDACTRCGRCHEACPATAAGLPLSPRDLVLDLQRAARAGPDPGIAPETLWSCMQCMACVEICPVGIEHVPVINLLRRGLIETGELDEGLQTVLEAVATSGNSFGEPRRRRARWTRELPFEVRDARREPVDVLWFVGDYASLDARNQRNTLALARLLEAAGVDFGILHDAERTAGNDIRRAGEEGLFRSVAEENIATIADCDFQRILTSDPHGFNTLRNEYPALGAPWTAEQVLHHSQLLGELLDAGALTVRAPLGRTVTYHDPCALGRYNGVYDEPRDLLRRIGLELVEMPRNRDNSFCCGAGGGRIWMREPQAGRPSEDRIREAVALGDRVGSFVVACPKDVTMYDDAIKTTGSADRIVLAEISELVAEACLEPEPMS
jgi:Fe-S oxidoreductase